MPRPRKFGAIPNLPNAGTPHQTPASLMFEAHYAQLRLVERWSWERYARLCNFLQMTPYEVASLVMLRHTAIPLYHRRGVLRGRDARPVAMLLTLIEAHCLQNWTSDVIKDPFPDLKGLSSTTEPIGDESHRALAGA